MRKALVVLSGGQDSRTCLSWAKEKYDEVEAISFTYGQNHKVEIQLAILTCTRLKVPHKVVDISFFKEFSDSALVTGGDVSEIKNGLPASFVPNRNSLFFTLAHAWAQKIGAKSVVTGVCQTDYSGYPDCRDPFIHALQDVLNKGSQADIVIEVPLMYLTKGETFMLADKLGILRDVIIETNTCYYGEREFLHEWGYGCGVCPACTIRAKGYSEYLELKQKQSYKP